MVNVKSWANYFIIIFFSYYNLLNQLRFQTPSISTSMTVIHRKSLYHFYWEFCTPSQSSSECTFQSVAPVWQHISNEQFVFCFSFFPKITKHHTVTAVLWLPCVPGTITLLPRGRTTSCEGNASSQQDPRGPVSKALQPNQRPDTQSSRTQSYIVYSTNYFITIVIVLTNYYQR